MNARRRAQGVFALLFCAALVAYAALCLRTHGAAMQAALSEIKRPASAEELRAITPALDKILYKNLYGRLLLSEAHARVQRFMGKYETNGFAILRDKEGFLEYGGLAVYSPEAARAQAQKLWRLKSKAAMRGGKLLFVSPPVRHRRYEPETYAADLPYPDLHALYDAVFYHLQRYGVASLDLRADFEKEALPFEAYAFRTDDRLTAEAAFAAFCAATEALNRDFGAQLDSKGFYRDIRNYEKTTYAQSFLGSLGKRAGIAFGGLDDFTVLWPTFPSLYELSAEKRDGSERTWLGPAHTTLLRPSVLKKAAETRDPYGTDLYKVYLGDAYPYARIRNLAAEEDAPRLLLLHDGGGAPLAVLLAPLFKEIRVIHTGAARSPSDAQSRLRDFMEKSPPDYIIVESRAENLEQVLP
jgi:hypothetical protein